MKAVIFDLDQTLIDSRIAQGKRHRREWSSVYKMIPEFVVYPGIDELITNLNKTVKIAIVTSSPSSYCSRVIKWRQWKIDVVVGYHDSTEHKPSPEPFLIALKRLDVISTEAVSIGDDPIDIRASKAAGILSVGVSWGIENSVNLIKEKPAFLCKNLDELQNAFKLSGI